MNAKHDTHAGKQVGKKDVHDKASRAKKACPLDVRRHFKHLLNKMVRYRTTPPLTALDKYHETMPAKTTYAPKPCMPCKHAHPPSALHHPSANYQDLIPNPHYYLRESHLIPGGHDLRLNATVRHQAIGAKACDGVNITRHAIEVFETAACAVLVGIGAARLAGRRRAYSKNALAASRSVDGARLAIGVFIFAIVAGGKQQKVLWVLRCKTDKDTMPRRSRQRRATRIELVPAMTKRL